MSNQASTETHPIEPWKLTASKALGKIQADEMSVQEYAESLLERIKARDEDVKAWAYLDEKRVMQEAKLLDETPKKDRGPLYGLLKGQKIYALMYDTLGWYGRSVDDLILPANIFAFWDDEDEDRSHGADVDELELPSAFDDVPEWYRIGLYTEGRTSFLLDDSLAAMRPVFDVIALKYAAIITPSVPDEAPIGLESTGSHVFCAMWSGLYVPVLNVSGFKGDHGMPIGLSLVAPRYRDRHLLEVGKAVGKIFEAEGGWETKIE
ncbi:amidase [Fusarium agapanthi]|uniref:Amidase n=1 Tax=Fusarium agapanthi TaxID=1803897 RepID=A0A9P5EC06_9HYPO|nr:amidase [Fusarium agapanthi]